MHKSILAIVSLLVSFVGCSGDDPGSGGSTTGTPPAIREESFSAGTFTVGAGKELIMCSYVRGDNTDAEDITRFTSAQSEGGHHLIVYTLDHNVDLPPALCSQGGQPGWSQILASGLPAETTTFPDGVGFHVNAHQQYVMETHYINTTSKPIEVKSEFTALYATAGTVKERASTYYVGTGNIDVPPNGVATAEVTCKPPSDLPIHTMFGHMHRFGTLVSVDLLPGGGGASQPLYTTAHWDNPAITTFDDGKLVGTADALHVKCDWSNSGPNRLGYPAEMCFAIGYYWPATASLMCASGGGTAACDCWYPDSVPVGAGGATVEVSLSRNDTIPGIKGDAAAGDPIYCSLFRATDWDGALPKPGARPVYYRSRVDVPLATSAATASFTLADVTPGDYVLSCYMDTVHGGFIAGSGDPVNSSPVQVTAVAGMTTTASALLDFAIP